MDTSITIEKLKQKNTQRVKEKRIESPKVTEFISETSVK